MTLFSISPFTSINQLAIHRFHFFQLYYHGEKISINVHIQNNSNKAVKKIRVCVRQFADICLFSTAQYKCTVANIESE